VRPLLLLLTLEAFYLTLSGQFHNRFLMIAGGVCCLGVTLISRHMRTVDDEGMPVRFWLKTALYVPWLMWQVFLANIDVAKRVWAPGLPIAPKMIKIPHSLKSGYGIATYANSITLTPGTVTVEAGDGEFLVHALTDEAAADLEGGEMHKRCKNIEGDAG
jgi:multicomponent Na+:H+ antiporter subunit E